MSIRIVALTHLAFPLVGLLAVSGSCNSTGGGFGLGAGGEGSGGLTSGGGSGGATGRGGSHSGGASGGDGGAGGGQSGTGGSARGGSGGGRGGASGAGGTSGGGGVSSGKDAGAGGSGKGGNSTQAGGSGGARSTIDAGPIACDDIETPGRLAVYYYGNSKVSDSAIQMHFDIVNYTAYTSRLQQVTVRYWFTDEDPTAANALEQYYVPIATTMKFSTLNPPRTGANTVLEISFRDAPDAGISWVETKGFNFAFHKTSYAGTYDQSNDYSYDPKLITALGSNPKITAYVNGVLAWGCEPTVQPVVVDAGGESVVDGGSRVDAPIAVPDAPADRTERSGG